MQRLRHGGAVQDGRGRPLDGAPFGGPDGAALVEGPSERVYDAADALLPDRDVQDAARALGETPRLQIVARAQQDHPDLVRIQVVGEAEQPASEAHQLLGADAGKAAEARDPLSDRDDPPYLTRGELRPFRSEEHTS